MDISKNTSAACSSPVRIDADHEVAKHLGNWTTSRAFAIRAHGGAVVLDLRSPDIEPGDIDIAVELDRGLLKLLVPEGARIEHVGHLKWQGRGRVKDTYRAGAQDGRVIRLHGPVGGSEIRVHRGGIAILSAMFSRAYVADVRRARREGTVPTLDDPTRDPVRLAK